MSLLIGMKSESGNIRYISVSTEYKHKFDKIVATLRNFYKSPGKVNTLIELGNLHWLGTSPYKKSKGEDDLVNCEAIIRDRKLSPGKHGTQFADSEEDFVKKLERDCRSGLNCCFLFDDGQWYILVGSHKENIKTIDASVLQKSTRMDGLTVYTYEPDCSYQTLSEKEFHTWEEVRASSGRDNKTYYIFRGEKLLTIIHPAVKKAS
ncbi:hypothetical protein [Dysgonomonas termitidis]|uniref:Uncharacterized protein n=1 Tax=Dysgonomonas termitidis TaxID=1516126 RepID=A0ABV9KRY0_9BACT